MILHGLFGSGNNWKTVAGALTGDYTVFSLDMRNHGRSFHSDRFDYDVMAGDLLNFMEAQNLQRVSLIGHSMGGKAAMNFAFSNPDRLHKLIIVDMANRTYDNRHGEIIKALYQLDTSGISKLRDADEMLTEAIPDTDMRLFLISNLERTENGRYRWRINVESIYRNQRNLTKAVTGSPFTGPALFVRGGKSDYLRDSDWPEILKYFPAAKLTTVKGAGHWVHIEAPHEFLNAVKTFLAP